MTLMDLPVAPPSPAVVPPSPALPSLPRVDDAERRMTLTGIRWDTYVRLSDEIGPGTRITYDRGQMEIVLPGETHEDVKTILARIVEAYADAIDVDAEGLGNWTMRREDLGRGSEPDECSTSPTRPGGSPSAARGVRST